MRQAAPMQRIDLRRVAAPALAIALVATAAAGVTYAAAKSSAARACETKKGVLVLATAKGKCPNRDHKVTIGAKGARGPAGPSNGYSVTSNTAVPLGAASGTTVVSVALPAGSFLLASSVEFLNYDTSQLSAVCNFVAGSTQSLGYATQATAGVKIVTSTLPGAGSVSLTSAVTLTTPTTVEVQCLGTSDLQAQATINAHRVGKLTPGGAGFS
jgi:hypothetical protein